MPNDVCDRRAREAIGGLVKTAADADFIVTLNPSDFPQSRLKAKVNAPTDPLPPRGRKLRPRRRRLVIRKK